MITDLYIIQAKPAPQQTLTEAVREICIKTEPKPLFCEIPDDLKIKTYYNFGTAFNSIASSATGPAGPISTTTTT